MSVVLEETKPESMFSIGGISFKSRASGARKETRDHGTRKEEELPQIAFFTLPLAALPLPRAIIVRLISG